MTKEINVNIKAIELNDDHYWLSLNAGAGAIDPTDPAAAAASKYLKLQKKLKERKSFLSFFSKYCSLKRFSFCCPINLLSETKALAEKQAKEAMAMAQAKCCLQ